MVTDLADDAAILAESMEVLVMALEVLQAEKSLGPKFSWTKTEVQTFVGSLDDTVRSTNACCEDVEVLESFSYLGSVLHNNA